MPRLLATDQSGSDGRELASVGMTALLELILWTLLRGHNADTLTLAMTNAATGLPIAMTLHEILFGACI